MFSELTLRRKLWRNDAFWTNSFIFSTPLIVIPHYLDRLVIARSQYWSRARMDNLTEKRLSDLFSHAVTIPYWKNILAARPISGSCRDYVKTLPIMTRADFKSMREVEYCSPALLAHSARDSTSGSTGVPFVFYIDRGELLSLWAIRERQCYVASDGKKYPLVIFRADSQLKKKFYKPYFVYLRGYNDVSERFHALEAEIKKVAAHGAVLYMFPSSAVALAQYMEREKKQLPLKALLLTGESISDEATEYVERILGTRISLAYGTQESSCIAFACEQRRTHINEEDIFVEIVDDTGLPVPPGQKGRVVLTHLGYKAMPFIRYHNGDLGTISEEVCPCGRTLRTITVVGRVPTLISQKDGYTITLTELAAIFNRYTKTVDKFQIVHKSPEELVFRLVPSERYEQFREQLEQEIVRKLHPEMHVSFQTVHHIESSAAGKMRYYIREYSD